MARSASEPDKKEMIMSTPKTFSIPSAGMSPHRTVARVIWQGIASLLHQRNLTVAEQQLRALDDRILNDIGVERSEIRSVVRDGRSRRSRMVPYY
jgi:uncharacterized protein YjiS (DUF1127 family)